jgi:FixJ family two-component response regulator
LVLFFSRRNAGPLPAAMSNVAPSVFVIDDDVSVRESLEMLIHSAGWHPSVFASMQDFLQRMEGPRPICLVLDMSLPDTSGPALQGIVARELPNVPVIMITGHEDRARIDRAMKAGAMACLVKPFSGEALIAAISSAVQRTG